MPSQCWVLRMEQDIILLGVPATERFDLVFGLRWKS